jgi:cobalt/nickel transport system ATP-binding protein
MSHHYLHFESLRYRYPGSDDDVLRDISFSVGHGEKVAITGNNGSGKSTLLLHTNGLLLPTSGKVVVGGVVVDKRSLRLVRARVGMLFQNSDDQLFMPTVEEDVAFGPRNMHLPEAEVRLRVKEALTMVDALHLAKMAPYKLSGGMKRRVALATVLSMQPDILVMDEPTAGLDDEGCSRFVEIIRSFPHTTLIVTHDKALMQKICQRVVTLHDGNIIADQYI